LLSNFTYTFHSSGPAIGNARFNIRSNIHLVHDVFARGFSGKFFDNVNELTVPKQAPGTAITTGCTPEWATRNPLAVGLKCCDGITRRDETRFYGYESQTMMNHAPIITFHNVSIRAGSKHVLRACSWSLYPQQQWVILGGQGSGKSAFGQAVAGKLLPSSGEIMYSSGTADAYDSPETFISHASFDAAIETNDYFVQSRYWSQDESPRVADYLCQENVLEINPFEVKPRGINRKSYQERKNYVMRLLGIEDLAQKETHQLSNGEARKVTFARTLLLNRPILVLDDPFGGIDASFKIRLRRIVGELIQSGKQCIVDVEHESDIPDGITHFALFSHGRIEKSGPISLLAGTNKPQPRFRVHNIPATGAPARCRTAALVEMRNVSVRYKTKPVVDDVSWTVHRGDRWLVSGPNGAGKTTLLSLILGDHPQAYANDIRIFGRQWGKGTVRAEIRKRIGWMSPELLCEFPLSISVWDAVCSGYYDTTGLFVRCPKERARHAQAWLRALDIHRCADMQLATLSQGIRRCALVARALVKNPDLLVLDEPFLGLDDAHAHSVAHCVQRYCEKSGAALIVVTHETETLPLANMKQLRMQNGKAYFK
jgi:molybdate transport system ATP-binding protein